VGRRVSHGDGGILGVDEAFLRERGRFVLIELALRRIPVGVNLGGGYEVESVVLHVEAARVAVEVLRACPREWPTRLR